MAYEPYTRTTERDVVVTPPSGPNYGGAVIAITLVVLAILGAIWLFSLDSESTTGDTTSPVETTMPTETTLPTDTAPATNVP